MPTSRPQITNHSPPHEPQPQTRNAKQAEGTLGATSRFTGTVAGLVHPALQTLHSKAYIPKPAPRSQYSKSYIPKPTLQTLYSKPCTLPAWSACYPQRYWTQNSPSSKPDSSDEAIRFTRNPYLTTSHPETQNFIKNNQN